MFTIGHSTRTLDEFTSILDAHGVRRIADIRTMPRSRHNPQFNRETLPERLAAAGISYVHLAALGGLRKSRADSPNAGWRDASFRGFADHMQTTEFREALGELVRTAGQETTTVMCAEAAPWRRHSSLVADALTIRWFGVRHIIDGTTAKEHVITHWAGAEADGTIVYPAQD